MEKKQQGALSDESAVCVSTWDNLTVSDLCSKIMNAQSEIERVLMKFTRETGVWLKVSADSFADYGLDGSTDEHRVVNEGYTVRATPTNL